MEKSNEQYNGLQLQATVSIKASMNIEDPAVDAMLRAHNIDPDDLDEMTKLGGDINQLINIAVQTALKSFLATDIADHIAISMSNISTVVPAGPQTQPET
jgi:hypothetical protein